ncbi:hypothetical protein [Legionella sainthelensi]|uniref:hypothetical protein n=1 Tax=Legionella sainthelensi TaxID=28087 RepID=UPI000EF298FB|nr:hypothetical protein [Legionella sainthelensi]AUH72796.2 hypothetical protein CAB17_12645 [Legionella sainthelensi]
MSLKGGAATIKGVNVQVAAGFSLFLQCLEDPKFSHIHLEAPGFQDFNLVFEDKKIICESKARKSAFSYKDLKEILLKQKNNIKSQDQILIICMKVNSQLIHDLKYLKYSSQAQLKFKEFPEEIQCFLSQVRFWNIPDSFNNQINYFVFAELLNFWLPQNELEKMTNQLIQQFYVKSANSELFSKEQFLSYIKLEAENIKNNSCYYNDEFEELEKQYHILEQHLENPASKTWVIPKELSALTAKSDLLIFALEQLQKKENGLYLVQWEKLWQVTNKNPYLINKVLSIFRKNMVPDDNLNCIFLYLKNNIKEIIGFYQKKEYVISFIIKLIKAIFESKKESLQLNDIFVLVQELNNYKESFLYFNCNKDEHVNWIDEEICNLLHTTFTHADINLKNEIIQYILHTFKITRDEGKYNFFVPKMVYTIIKEWVEEDVEFRFLELVKLIAEEYSSDYKQIIGRDFNGWEYASRAFSSTNGIEQIHDHHFITDILTPSIKVFYHRDPEKCWSFVKENCIVLDQNVTNDKPDFLSRSILEIILLQYAKTDNNISQDAFKILHQFILSTKGLPLKSDLIFQIATKIEIGVRKIWRLILVTLEEYKVPTSYFVEKIVVDLALKGNAKAKKKIKEWFQNPDYYSMFRGGLNFTNIIDSLITDQFDFATELFEILIFTPEAISRGDFSYLAGNILRGILRHDYKKGFSLLRSLESQNTFNETQQIIYFSSFCDNSERTNDSPSLLLKIHNEVLKPFLSKYGNNIEKIIEIIPDPITRSLIIKFSYKLAKAGYVSEALYIINIFLKDPNPETESDKILKGEEDNTISSVRGWCAWALGFCLNVNRRDKIPEVIDLINVLLDDDIYYVVQMASSSFANVMLNRFSCMPHNRSILFFNDSLEIALTMAKEVEKTAFNYLKNFENWPVPIQKSMAQSLVRVLNSLRHINNKDTLYLVSTLAKLPEDIVFEFAELFIYFAEVRKTAFVDWEYHKEGLYDDLCSEQYDEIPIKNIVINVIQRVQSNNPRNSFKFISAIEHLLRDNFMEYEFVAFSYIELVTPVFEQSVFDLIYQIINEALIKTTQNKDKWFDLLIDCLQIEKNHYVQHVSNNPNVYLKWMMLRHSDILELVYEKFDANKFLEACELYFSFPKQVCLHESEILVQHLVQLSKINNNLTFAVKQIIDNLYTRNPNQYLTLKRELDKAAD